MEKAVNFVKSMGSGLMTYLKESRAELRKVQWPNRKETTTYTAIVITVSLGASLFIWIIDQGMGLLLSLLV